MNRSIFLKLKSGNLDAGKEVVAFQAILVSYDLYSSDIVSAFDFEKSITQPINSNNVAVIPENIIDAQRKLQAKRNLAQMLRYKATFKEHVKVGKLVKV